MNPTLRALLVIATTLAPLTAGCATTHSNAPPGVSAAGDSVPLPMRAEVTGSPDVVVERSVDIAAPPERVFAILLDVSAWTRWDPSVTTTRAYAGRPLEVGDRFFQDPGGYAGDARVLDVVPSRALRWKGGNPDGSGVTGVHTFRLIGLANGGTRVIDREEFSKWYLRLIGWATDLGVGSQFERTLAGLKRFAEAS